ncbi:alpha/beta hydrolase [Bacillus sp. FJAT-42376]|uniref:alpha/beta fold hydrolase n=1 Tax=Bacillus sp. FJAT-42376 TaxID=2014076 RepID=UPI000F4E0152|nr:alpha/beta hydrolase [Bacillus sp. FJAT-42376]AZB42176.1 alpha/beta hydrolase [Bacillus sp. FJAT-42376]
MQRIKKIMMYSTAAIILFIILALFFPSWTSNIKGDNSIHALEQVKINGSNHEIMIRGTDKNHPVVLFVHGGPGSSEIPYAAKFQDLLESNFTVVQYDQRASGKSYHFFEDYSNLSTDLLVDDLLAMTDYISKRLGKEKVILAGHSFGTYIAALAASEAPEKYEAYVGIGQMSDTAESETDSLNYTINQAQKAENTKDVSVLKELADKIKKGEAFTPRDLVMKYGGASRGMNSPDGNNISMLLSTEYNLLDVIRYNYGIAFSQETLVKEVLKKPLSDRVKQFDLPIYFVMGKYDYMTSTDAAKTYFDQLNAGKKEFITFDQSAHYPQLEEKEHFNEWMYNTFIKNK